MMAYGVKIFFFFSSRRRHTRFKCDWSSDVCSSDLLEASLAMLRREGMPEVALALGVGHWRPREHVPGAGRELVQAAAEAGRISEARRHLDALAEHPEADVVDLREQLDDLASRRPAAR